jgi:hypothetical protein
VCSLQTTIIIITTTTTTMFARAQTNNTNNSNTTTHHNGTATIHHHSNVLGDEATIVAYVAMSVFYALAVIILVVVVARYRKLRGVAIKQFMHGKVVVIATVFGITNMLMAVNDFFVRRGGDNTYIYTPILAATAFMWLDLAYSGSLFFNVHPYIGKIAGITAMASCTMNMLAYFAKVEVRYLLLAAGSILYAPVTYLWFQRHRRTTSARLDRVGIVALVVMSALQLAFGVLTTLGHTMSDVLGFTDELALYAVLHLCALLLEILFAARMAIPMHLLSLDADGGGGGVYSRMSSGNGVGAAGRVPHQQPRRNESSIAAAAAAAANNHADDSL